MCSIPGVRVEVIAISGVVLTKLDARERTSMQEDNWTGAVFETCRFLAGRL